MLDVHYAAPSIRAAALVFEDWRSDTAAETAVIEIASEPQPYAPGAFYKRELPPLRAAIGALKSAPSLLLIDAFVHLGSDRKPGLGRRLWEALDQTIPVIGVAKNAFDGASEKTAVRRGESQNPLYVTAIGVDEDWARDRVQEMHGPHRIPTLLKKVDQLSRGLA